MKKKIVTIFVTMMMFSSFSLLNSTDVAAKQQNPQLSKSSVTMNVGKKKTLKIKKNEKNAKIFWKSNKPKIVTVSKKGILTAKSSGNATIRATVKQNGKKFVLKCKVKVKKTVETKETTISPLPVPLGTEKKNTLFDTFSSNGVSKIYYYINDNSYVVSNQKKISAILSYMSLLEVEPIENPKVMGGFSMILAVFNQQQVTIGLQEDIFNIDGQYYKIKNSALDITTVIKLFLGV